MPLFKLGGSTGGVTSVGLTAPSSILAVTGSPVTTAGVLALALVTQAANLVWAGPTAGAAADPTFRSLVAADIPDLSGVYQPLNAKLTAFSALANAAGVLTNDGSGVYSWAAASTGTVTSVALTVPSFLSVAGSPVTTSGTFAVTLANQTANTVFAGPGTGSPAAPTFRALVAADIPDLSGTYQPLNAKLTAISALANAAGVLTNDGSGVFSYTTPATGTVTSVALAAPAIFSVTGSPVTTSGTLTFALATQSANLVFAGPGTGVAAAPTFRALVVADIPDLSGVYQPLNAKLTAIAALANAAGSLTNNGAGVFSYVVPTTGTVTSVAMTVPSFLSVAGSPITGSGTLAVTLATETANFVFAGPTTGAAATPTFRALVAADFASIPATTFTMATARILGRTTAGTGAVEELTAGTSLSLSSGSLNTIQGIRTTDTPQFARLGVAQAADAAIPLAVTGQTWLNGHVGVGTSSPGSSGSFRFLTVAGGSTSQGGVIQTQVSDASVIGTFLTTNAGVFVNAQTNSPLFLKTNDTTRFTITTAGDVGIGTSSPGSFGSLRFFTVQGSSATQGGHIQTQTSDASIIGYLNTANSSLQLTAQTNHPIAFFTNNTLALTLSTAQNATFVGTVTATTYSAAVAAGGTMVTLNASTGTANTGGSIVFQRGASNKWSIGTGISIGSDAFEIYDRVNSLSLFSMVLATGNVTLAGNVTTGGIITATGAAAGMAITVPAGGGGLVLNAGTGTANTGMNLTWQRGASSKWNLGTGISLGADAFELYDRANGVSAFSVATSTSALTIRSSLTTGNPSGGTALPIKFGSYVAGAPAATGYQQIEINGTAYKLLCST